MSLLLDLASLLKINILLLIINNKKVLNNSKLKNIYYIYLKALF
jgi:hypothetical protein